MDPTQIISIGSQVLPVAKTAIENLSSATDAFARELLGVGDRSVESKNELAGQDDPVSFQLQYQQVIEQIRGVLQNSGVTEGLDIELKVSQDGRVEVLKPKELADSIAGVINSNDDLINNLNSLREKHEDFLWRHPGPNSFQSPLLRGAAQQGFRIPLTT